MWFESCYSLSSNFGQYIGENFEETKSKIEQQLGSDESTKQQRLEIIINIASAALLTQELDKWELTENTLLKDKLSSLTREATLYVASKDISTIFKACKNSNDNLLSIELFKSNDINAISSFLKKLLQADIDDFPNFIQEKIIRELVLNCSENVLQNQTITECLTEYFTKPYVVDDFICIFRKTIEALLERRKPESALLLIRLCANATNTKKHVFRYYNAKKLIER